MLSRRCTLLMLSCDSRADIWRPSLTLFDRYWPDCPFPQVVVSETIGPRRQGWRDFLGGKLPFSDLLVKALDSLACEEVVITLDDFLLRAPVDTAKVLALIEEGKRLGAECVRLRDRPQGAEPVGELFKVARPETVHAWQFSWWKKATLRALLVSGDNQDQWEARSLASKLAPERVLVVNRNAIEYCDAVQAGRWKAQGRTLTAREGVPADTNARPTICWNNA